MKNLLLFMLILFVAGACRSRNEDKDKGYTSQLPPDLEENKSPTAQMEDNVETARVWRLESFGKAGELTRIPEEVEVTLMLNLEENQFLGKAACNDYMAILEESDAGLAISEIRMTEKACQPTLMDLQDRFLQMLRQVDEYQVDGGILTMVLNDGRQLIFTS